MVKYKSNCTVCQKSKLDVKLRNRIRYAAFKREPGDETLSDIGAEYGLSVPSMYNHAKKHITDMAESYQHAKETKVAKQTQTFRVQAQKELETAIDGSVLDTIEARPQEIIALDDYIAMGKKLIDNGTMKVSAQSFLAAVKIKNDWSAKQASTKLDFFKAVYALSSGNKKKVEPNGQANPSDTGEDATVDNRGADQAADIYRELAGNQTP